MRIFLCILAIVLWVVALFGFYHVVVLHLADPKNTATAVVAYAAALLALLGWMIQAALSLRSSRKQHTMNVLLQSRLSTEFNKHVDKIRKEFPDETEITFESATKAETFESIRYILNYYEFIAVGIKHGDLDERLLRDCLCTQVCKFTKRTDNLLKTVRKENAQGIAAPGNARIYKNLRELHRQWDHLVAQPERTWLGFEKIRS